MAELHKSFATLRIFGDSLDPNEISKILGCPHTRGYLKGQVWPAKSRGIVQKTGSWLLESAPQTPADLDAQVRELFSRMNNDLAVWEKLASNFKIDLFCSFYMYETDEGLEVSPATMKMLAERGIKLSVCIYAPNNEPMGPANPLAANG